MAAYHFCFRTILTLSRRTFHPKLSTENQCIVISDRLFDIRSRASTFHDMTNQRKCLVRSLANTHGRSHEREEERERPRCFNFAVLFVPAFFKEFFSTEKVEGSTPEDDLIIRIKKCIYYKQVINLDQYLCYSCNRFLEFV